MLFFSLVVAAQTLPAGERLAETQARDNLAGLLRAKQIAFRERPLMADYGAFGVSIQAEFSGTEGGGLFVLVVPQAGRAPDGGLTWGQQTAFAFIERILLEPPPFDTLVCFLADNRPAVRSGAYPYAGLCALLDDLHEDTVIVHCDFPDAPAVLTVTRGRGRTSLPLAPAESFVNACVETETPYFFATGRYETESVVAERGGSIPVLYLDDSAALIRAKFTPPPALANDSVAETLYRFAAAALPHGTAAMADRNYAYIHFSEGIFVSEYTLVVATLFISTLWVLLGFLLYCASKSCHRRIFSLLLATALLITAAPLAVLHLNSAGAAPSIPKNVQFSPLNKDKDEKNFENPLLYSYSDEAERYFTVGADSVPFLERRIVRIRIEARQTPLNYRLSFTESGAKDGAYLPANFLYDAPMPYTAEDDIVRFVLGDYPPMLLDIEITLSLDIDGYFTLDALFEDGANIIETFTAG
jgi:hypothetical protein